MSLTLHGCVHRHGWLVIWASHSNVITIKRLEETA